MAETIRAGAPVGFIGLGIMGAAMARNLMQAGFKVHAHNRSRAKAEALAREGAAACATPADVAQASVAIVLCLPDAADVEQVLFGETGIVRDALLGGSAQSFLLQNHGKRLLDGALAPGFRASLMWKDIELALNAGRETGAFMPVTALGAQMLAALCNLRCGELGPVFEELSGLRR